MDTQVHCIPVIFTSCEVRAGGSVTHRQCTGELHCNISDVVLPWR